MVSSDVPNEEFAAGSSQANQSNILSSKVSRALEVRSDTPAMKAALDALAHLPSHKDDLFSVDSRSVRVAIEHDALQQALLLQGELKSLLDTVSTLRKGVADTAAIAHRVEEAIQTSVVSKALDTELAGDETKQSTEDGIADALQSTSLPADQALEQEQRLASLLNDAFMQRNAARTRLETVHTFMEKFDLSQEDSRLLDHYAFDDVETSNVNGSAFLTALERVRVIRKELGKTFGSMDYLHSQSRTKSASELDSNQLGASSALRMMETLAQKQERAYERLYHWLQKYLHVYGHETPGSSSFGASDDDVLDEALSHPFVRRSLAALRNVPPFYSHLLELIAQSRRSEETRRFLLALTSGYGGMPPIEMRAHDSVVYVGDMLAFCFQAFSVEADVARGLLENLPESEEKLDEQAEEVVLAEEDTDYLAEKPISATEMLSQSMGGVARPLKARILQVIANLSRRPEEADDSDDELDDDLDEEGAGHRNRISQLYEICGLLLFYSAALGKSISKLEAVGSASSHSSGGADDEPNPLLSSMFDSLGESVTAYEASLRVYGATLGQFTVLTGESEAMLSQAMISRLVDVRKASPGFAGDVSCPAQHRQRLSIDWPCELLFEAALPVCKTLDDTVCLRQSIAIASQVELSYDISSALESKVQEKETILVDDLVEQESSDVLDLCGLGSLVTAWNGFQSVRLEGMVMATHPGLTPEDVQTAMSEFYSSLYSPPLPSLEGSVKDPTLRKLARSKIAQRVCLAYEELYDAMSGPDKGGYDDLSFLGHTPEQVRALFAP